jgi:aspartate aminotransferase-like enzyme
MRARRSPPPTSYLDLLQLQTYWSPERLNHHTAPTSLIYGLREALRLLHDEGLTETCARHRWVGETLRRGLDALGLDVGGTAPYAIVRLPERAAEGRARRALLEQFGIHVTLVGEQTWRVGLLAADARPESAQRLLAALQHILAEKAPA